MKIGKTLLAVAALAVAGVLAAAAMRPDSFRVQRTATVQAPPEKLHAMISDLHQFNTWNPFNKKDPNIRGSYRGPQAGPGARYDFAGNGEVGKGSLEVTGATPQKITMLLHMIEPMEGRNTVEFSLAPRGAATEVTWAMHGPSPFVSKLMGLVFDMDAMIGGAFDAGLADLKQRAERG